MTIALTPHPQAKKTPKRSKIAQAVLPHVQVAESELRVPTAINPSLTAVLKGAPKKIRTRFEALEKLVAEWPSDTLRRKEAFRAISRRFGIGPKRLYNIRCDYRKRGGIALVNCRVFAPLRQPRRAGLPLEFVRFVRALSVEAGLSRSAAVNLLKAQLRRWRKGDAAAALPGYKTAPRGKTPPGWSTRNLCRHLPARPCAEVTAKLRADGKTIITKGKLSSIARHPLYDALRQCLAKKAVRK